MNCPLHLKSSTNCLTILQYWFEQKLFRYYKNNKHMRQAFTHQRFSFIFRRHTENFFDAANDTEISNVHKTNFCGNFINYLQHYSAIPGKSNFCSTNKKPVSQPCLFYQLGLKYTMHGIFTLTDLTESKVLLSSKI